MVWGRIIKFTRQNIDKKFYSYYSDIVNGSSLLLQSNCVARSVGAGSSFDVKINNTSVGQIAIPPIGTGQFDLFAQQATAIALNYSIPRQFADQLYI